MRVAWPASNGLLAVGLCWRGAVRASDNLLDVVIMSYTPPDPAANLSEALT